MIMGRGFKKTYFFNSVYLCVLWFGHSFYLGRMFILFYGWIYFTMNGYIYAVN